MGIIDDFYNNFIEEAKTGRIDCGMYYNIIFSTIITDKDNQKTTIHATDEYEKALVPVLNINNKQEFDSLLVQYVTKAKEFYSSNNKNFEDVDDIDKSIMARLFANATYEDFNNPIEFISKRINMLNDEIIPSLNGTNLGYSEILNGTIKLNVVKEPIHEETPYAFQFYIEKEEDKYYFPLVRVGLSSDKAYIYSIQSKKDNESNSFTKKISRSLKKIGAGFDQDLDNEDTYGIGNTKDVTDSFLIALTMTLGVLDNNGITDIVAPSILVERWNAKEIFYEIFTKRMMQEKNISREEAEGINIKQVQNHDRLQSNISDKFIRTFRRLAEHTNRIIISANPMDIDFNLHAKIDDSNNFFNNPLICDVYNLAKNSIKEKTK